MKHLLTISLCVLVAAGCVAHSRTPYTAAANTVPVATPGNGALFDYQRTEVVAKNRTVKDRKQYDLRYLRFPSSGENGQPDNLVTGYYYRSKAPGKKKLVVVLPIWGTTEYPSEKIGRGIHNRGVTDTNVLVIEGKNYIFDWNLMANAENETEFKALVGVMAERMRATVVDIRRLLDWAESQADIDPERIGIVGFSMSAVITALAIAVDPRPASVVLVMGAANPAKVITTCTGRLAELKAAVTTKFGWNDQRYYEAVEPMFRDLDPGLFRTQVDPEKILIIESGRDNCMPQDTRDALWESMGQPEKISLPYPHKIAFLSITPIGFNHMRRQIYAFLEETL